MKGLVGVEWPHPGTDSLLQLGESEQNRGLLHQHPVDRFLSQLFQAPDYTNGSTLVILTWDEGNETGSRLGLNCAHPRTWPDHGSCQIATILISPSMSGGWINQGAVTSPLYSHYSILQLVERNCGLATLGTPSPTPEFWGSYTGAPLFPMS